MEIRMGLKHLNKVKKRNLIISLLIVILPLIIAGTYIKMGHSRSSCMENCTGSPGDGGQTCASCHWGAVEHINDAIYTSVPAEGYAPGNTYNITLHFWSQDYGRSLEITAENSIGSITGVFIAGGNTYTTYDSSSVMGCYLQDSVFNFQWKAPSVNSPDTVVFYSAFNTFDTVTLSSLKIPKKPVLINSVPENKESNIYINGHNIYIFRADHEKATTIIMFDLQGKQVIQLAMPCSEKEFCIPVPDNLKSGKYFLRFGNRTYPVIYTH